MTTFASNLVQLKLIFIDITSLFIIVLIRGCVLIHSVHCFFEQSGTFKNEFLKLGFPAFDYDLCNDFGQTDYRFDLFESIDLAFKGRFSPLDHITPDDLIFAFFPCVRFEDQSVMLINCSASQFQKLPGSDKVLRSLEYSGQLFSLYERLCHLVYVCLKRGIPLIVENPYTPMHFLTRYFPFKPGFIDYDRRERGDYFKKPTQYFFFNFEPKHNLIFEPCFDNYVSSYERVNSHTFPGVSRQVARSLISSDYANRFIREFIL